MRTGIRSPSTDTDSVLPVFHSNTTSNPSKSKVNRLWSRIQRRRKARSGYNPSSILASIIAVLLVTRVFLVPYGWLDFIYQSEPDNSGFNDLVTKEWGPHVSIYDFTQQFSESNDIGGHLLLCMPLRNAEDILDDMFDQLYNLTYDHKLIDLAFMVGDSTDNTFPKLQVLSSKFQKSQEKGSSFHRIDIFQREFDAKVSQNVDERHGVAVQGVRRKLMGRARNWLLTAALKPYHSYVYWRDADIVSSPNSIIQDLMKHKADVIVPNVWRPLPKYMGGEQPYDLNSWVESSEAEKLARTLPEDDVIVEGYAEYATWRVHLAYLRAENGNGNPDDIMDLDGIGGVSILARAKVFRAGANFPGFAFMNHAETEGFGKMCRRMGFTVKGLPNYVIWHAYEPSDEDKQRNAERLLNGLSID